MNCRFVLSLAMLVAGATWSGPALAGGPFEGRLYVRLAGAGIDNEATMHLRGDKARVEPKRMTGAVRGYPVVNFGQRMAWLVSVTDKYFMEIPLAPLEKKLKETPLVLAPTGKKGTVAGEAAERFDASDAETATRVEVWATSAYKPGFNYLIFLTGQRRTVAVAARANQDLVWAKGLFPLKFTVTDESGAQAFSWEVLKIEAGPVDEAQFVVPAGYSRMSEILKKKCAAGPRGR